MHRNIAYLRKLQVTILAGHEPAHVGYIGYGMIHAAVLGPVFSSPSTDAILAAIFAIAGPHGVLIIVKNYLDDRIKFMLAAMRARDKGVDVRMVIVGDDCTLSEEEPANDGKEKPGKQHGVAGTVLVHKIAGAAAQAGLGIDAVCREAAAAKECIRTLGVSVKMDSVPRSPLDHRLHGDQTEIGLGIQREPQHGALQMPWKTCDQLIEGVTMTVVDRLKLTVADNVALLVNNLGSATLMEMNIAARKVSEIIVRVTGRRPSWVYVGTYMTSLDRQGISVTLMRVNREHAQFLDAPASAPSWRRSEAASKVREIEIPERDDDDDHFDEIADSADDPVIPRGAIHAVCRAIIAAEPELTKLDEISGDGDCGMTMKKGANEVNRQCKRFPVTSAPATFKAIARCLHDSMAGASGALLTIFFRAGQCHLLENENDFVGAFTAGVKAIGTAGGAKLGMRSMLDAMIPAARALEKSGGSLIEAAEAAECGAQATRRMSAGVGHSQYRPKAILTKAPDPGAKAVAISLKALSEWQSEVLSYRAIRDLIVLYHPRTERKNTRETQPSIPYDVIIDILPEPCGRTTRSKTTCSRDEL